MNSLSNFISLLIIGFSLILQPTVSFSLSNKLSFKRLLVQSEMTSQACDMSGHPSQLPGDPSLNLVTNVDLGDKKLEIMKGKLKFVSFE